MTTFWFFKNERLADALSEYEREFPILNEYFTNASLGIKVANLYAKVAIRGDVVAISGEKAGYVLEDYFFNERESLKFSEFLGEGWFIDRARTNFYPKSDEWKLLFKD